MEERSEVVEAHEDESKEPSWIIREDKLKIRVLFEDEDEYAVIKALSTAGHIQLDAQRDKMSNLEYAMSMVDRTVEEWTLRDPDGNILPIPISVPKKQRDKLVWSHVPTKYAQRMAIAASLLAHPGGDGLGGELAKAVDKDDSSFTEDLQELS